MRPDGLLLRLVLIFAAVAMTTAAVLFLVGSQLGTKVEPIIPVGMVAPHHDIVEAQRTQLFEAVRAKGVWPSTVVLVSPNHFEAGKANVQVTKRTWTTADGNLAPDMVVIDNLIASGAATEETDSFNGEHGIKLMLADIRTTWNGARVVPIMLKFNTPLEEISALADALKTNCAKCFVVASVDFSHYQPEILADLHDVVSSRVLANLDQVNVLEKAEVDSPASLALLMGWAERNDAQKFVEWKRTNSGTLTHDSQVETTTHIFGWYEKGARTAAEKSVTFSLARLGDIQPLDVQSLFSTFGDRVLWGTDASLLEVPNLTSVTRLKRATQAGVIHPLTGDVLQTETYSGEGMTLDVLWAHEGATPDLVTARLASVAGTYQMVITGNMTPETQIQWLAAGADLIVLREGELSVEKMGSGAVVRGLATLNEGLGAVIAGKFTSDSLDIFSLTTDVIDGGIQVTFANPLLHFPLK